MNPKFKFEELKVYQKALDFVDNVYELTKDFPKEELYALTAQYRRAALSIALNIGEGHGDTDAQFNRYLTIAWDSVKECVVCSTIAKRRKYINEEKDILSRRQLEELAKMIMGLKKYIKNK